MSKIICGMTFDEYVDFHCEFVDLMRKIGEGEAKNKHIIPFLKDYGLEPVVSEWNPKEIDPIYYMSAGLQPWEEFINQDPDLQAKKAMKLIEFQNKQFHGDSSESADIEIEGLTLDGYAHICANLTGAGGDLNALYVQYGIKDQDHFNRINEAFMAAMAADTTGMLTTHYSDFYMKHAPEHAAAVHQTLADAMAENTERLADNDERSKKVPKKLRKMAQAGEDPEALIAYVREAIPDADDDEELDLYMEEASEALAEKEKWKALKIMLEARFILLNPGGSMDEWIEDETESLK